MQHDTTVYRGKLAEQVIRVIASLLYLRYSKRRYLKFYRVFNRFAMKCFFHEALMHWGYAALLCIIDNTNLARLRGSGKQAVIVPEMVSFAERYGFCYRCHEIRHSDRKAGEERSFWTVETNFLPGRTFDRLEDLHRQAYEWATVRMHHRLVKKTGLIPAKAFEHERRYLIELSPQLPAPYCVLERGTDEYGYLSFQGNYDWVPGSKREDVKVLLLRKFSRYDCLLIDEVGYVEVEPSQVGLFFTLMQKRHKTKTTLITSNLGFHEWGTFLKNKHLASALFDRLSATTHVFNMKDCVSLRPRLNERAESDLA